MQNVRSAHGSASSALLPDVKLLIVLDVYILRIGAPAATKTTSSRHASRMLQYCCGCKFRWTSIIRVFVVQKLDTSLPTRLATRNKRTCLVDATNSVTSTDSHVHYTLYALIMSTIIIILQLLTQMLVKRFNGTTRHMSLALFEPAGATAQCKSSLSKR